MYRLLSICSIGLCFCTLAFAKNSGDKLQRHSGVGDGPSIPQPFVLDGDNPVNQPPISTGYYFVDSDDPVGAPWRPDPAAFTDTTDDPGSWRRIISGPRQQPREFYEENPEEGERFFRNPGDPSDSTDNAFAGPIPIGFEFYFNGIRYDSFYVSTNGLIALSNRRYVYDEQGNRTIPPGATTAYDPHSDDDASERFGSGLEADDPRSDDFGYRFIALGNDPNNPTAGIRNPNNGGLADFAFKAPILAPLWGDAQLSQFNQDENRVDDYGKAYYKRLHQADKLIIYFVNLTPINTKEVPSGTVHFPMDNRPGTEDNHVRANVQIILDRSDSSITYVYRDFRGVVVVDNHPVFSPVVWRFNSTIGVRGRAQYPNNDDPVRYTQFTEYLVDGEVRAQGKPGTRDQTPHHDLAIKFKQWKNVLRAVDVDFMIRDPRTQEFTVKIEDPSDFELLIDDPLLGAVQPIVTYQNLTNNIQGPDGVNYQPGNLSFEARFRIRNDIEERFLYNRRKCIDSFALTIPHLSGVALVDSDEDPLDFPGPNNLNGVPAYGLVRTTFDPWEKAEFQDNCIGRLTAEAIANSINCENEDVGDQWPFDDTLRVRLFGLRVLNAFSDNSNDFSLSPTEGPIPSVKKWVNIGAEVVDGNSATWNPPPPRGLAGADPQFRLNSPTIRLNRIDLDSADLGEDEYGGDQLISFPIDMRGQHGAVLSFSYQRVGRPPGDDYPRGWAYGFENYSNSRRRTLVGPEPRVIYNSDPTQLAPGSMPDELLLEYAAPSPNRYDNIVNIPEDQWSRHPRSDRPGEYTDNPALSIFGAGGGRRGWSAQNPDSALSREQGLEPDIYDDGKDFRFRKAYFRIPDAVIDASNDGAKFFRFRLRVHALRNASDPLPLDDADDFFVDNVRIIIPDEKPDLEAHNIRVDWPYQVMPASQATEMPISVTVSNNSNVGVQSFTVQAIISRKEDGPQVPADRYVYCRSHTIPVLGPRQEIDIEFPAWNARLTTPGDYVIAARLFLPGGDQNNLNDSTYTEFRLEFSDVMGYDSLAATNDVPRFSRIIGSGLNLFGANVGTPNFNTAYGPHPSPGSGSIAMKFTLNVQDTIYGYSAFFGALGATPRTIRFALYRDDNGVPGARISESEMHAEPGEDPVTGERFFNIYRNYRLEDHDKQKIVLAPGDYWMSCSQLAPQGFELGGSAFRAGSATTNFTDDSQLDLGATGTSLNIFNGFRTYNAVGELVNDNVFAYENAVDSDEWRQFTPTVGNHAYADLRHDGLYAGYPTYSRGTWIPMLRPFFGERSYADAPRYEECDPITSVEIPEEPPIADYNPARLLGGYPNPFTKRITLEFSVPHQAPVRVDIVNMAGAIVRTLLNGFMQPTERVTVVWDGVDERGAPAPAGMYLTRITIGAQTLFHKIMYIE